MSTGQGAAETRSRTVREHEEALPEPRGFGAITRDRRDVEERIATLVASIAPDDPDALARVNDLLDDLDDLRREFGRMTQKKTVDGERYRAQRYALGEFTRRVPSKAIDTAETNLKKALAAVVPRKTSLAGVEEALFGVQVANGFANARYVLSTAPFADFRDRVADHILVRAAANGSEEARRALESVSDDVRRLMPLPPAPDEDDIIAEWDDPGQADG